MGWLTKCCCLFMFYWALVPQIINAQTKTIVIGESVRGGMYLPVYIAEEKNFFKKRDLDTKIVTFSRSNDLNALIGGDIQFDLTAPEKVIYGAMYFTICKS